MQVRRHYPSEEGGVSVGKPLPKALQNSPYASAVLAPGLHKKISRGKSSDKINASSHQRQPRLSRGDRATDSDYTSKHGHHGGPPSDIFAPSLNQRESGGGDKQILVSPRSAGAMSTAADGVVAYRSSTVRKHNASLNNRPLSTSPRGGGNTNINSGGHNNNNSKSGDRNTSLALPNVKGTVSGPSLSLLKAANPKLPSSSTSTGSTRASNSIKQTSSQSQITSHSKNFEMRHVGLSNLGNTCFMNSALQCILHVKPLILYFNGGHFEQDLNTSSPTKGKVAVAFAELVRDVFSTQTGGSLTPTRFKKEITKLAPHLLDYEQQDCQEFLRFLLDGLSEDLGRQSLEVKQKTSVSNSSTNNTTDSPVMSNNLLSLALGDDESTSSPVGSPTTNPNNRPQPPANPKSLPDKFRSKVRSISSNEIAPEPQGDNGALSSETDVESVGKDYDISTFKKLQQQALGRQKSRQNVLNAQMEQVIKESSLSWNNFMKKNNSIITDIFGGQLQSTIECLTCHHRSHCFDPFLDLSVPIELPTVENSTTEKDSKLRNKFGLRSHSREPSSCSLEDCFASYSATEMLEGDNAYNCEKCKSKQKSSKRLAIYKYPQMLIIHIKRFRYTAIRREKMNTDVKFPSHGLDLKSYLSSDSIELSKIAQENGGDVVPPPVYDLLGVANHSGGMNGGHYIAHVNASVDGAAASRDKEWLCFNDCRISQTSVSSAGGSSAYMLFYKRRETPNNSRTVQI